MMKNLLSKKATVTLLLFLLATFQNIPESLGTSSETDMNTRQSIFSSALTWYGDFFARERYIPGMFLKITDIKTFPRENEVFVTWIVGTLVSKSRIYYDTESPVTIASTTRWTDASPYGTYANSKGTVRNLNASTTYYFKIFTEVEPGETSVSKESTFTTLP